MNQIVVLYWCRCSRKMPSAYCVCVIRSVLIWSRWVEAADSRFCSNIISFGGRRPMQTWQNADSVSLGPVRASGGTSGVSRSWRIHFLKSCYSIQQLRQTPRVFSWFDSVLAVPFWTHSMLFSLLSLPIACSFTAMFSSGFYFSWCFRNSNDLKIMSKQMLK